MHRDAEQTPPLSEAAQHFRHGLYRHYKGGMYRTITVGRSSEARDEEFAVYESLDKGNVWIRPLGMFLEHVEVGEYRGPRFMWIGERDKKL